MLVLVLLQSKKHFLRAKNEKTKKVDRCKKENIVERRQRDAAHVNLIRQKAQAEKIKSAAHSNDLFVLYIVDPDIFISSL